MTVSWRALLAGGALVLFSFSPVARASVSIAAAYDALVGTADSIAVVTPKEAMSAWEDGRIYTYTRVRVDSGIAGELGTGGETWVKTRGGVVGKIGQIVDGEAVFVVNSPSLVFLRKGSPGAFEVSARAQGQYPIVVDPAKKKAMLTRNANVGVLYPAKTDLAQTVARDDKTTAQSGVKTPLVKAPTSSPVLAADMIQGRAVEDVARDLASAYKRLHAP